MVFPRTNAWHVNLEQLKYQQALTVLRFDIVSVSFAETPKSAGEDISDKHGLCGAF